MARKKKPRGQADNPFKPGAGHSPPYLAGREDERDQFKRFLAQTTITDNVVLTGLRGVGKTVLMDDVYKPLALSEGWVWVGADFSESAFVDEAALCRRILTDLSVYTSALEVETERTARMGLTSTRTAREDVDYEYLGEFFNAQPGLNSDKLKATLEWTWNAVKGLGKKGILFAYDEAQVVQDRKKKEQYPLALLLETFQSIQRKGVKMMLLLTGLPTLFPKLVESRTYAERMFKIQEIGKLNEIASRKAITEPLKGNAIQFTKESIDMIVQETCGYPYFIQFICREAYDIFQSAVSSGITPSIPIKTLVKKLDSDFFAGRWAPVPDRQRELLFCIANLENAADEFTVNQIADISHALRRKDIRPFKYADVSSMMPKLINAGLVYKNRHGKYSLAVPLLHGFVKRQFEEPEVIQLSLFD
ncbi:MAG: ATP-binding protein [Planctomycetes bacterium]|nr:ATP-binding protein [Planctomycetota bacterium]